MLAERDKQILRQLDTQLQTFFYDRAMEAVEAANITYDTCQKARAVDLTDNLDRNFINQWVSFYDAPDTFMRNIFEFLAPEMAPDTLDMVTKVYEREKLAECTQPVMMDKLEGPKTGILEDLKEVLFDEAEEALPDTLPDHFFDKCKKEPKMLFPAIPALWKNSSGLTPASSTIRRLILNIREYDSRTSLFFAIYAKRNGARG
jgi:hypothetical protein